MLAVDLRTDISENAQTPLADDNLDDNLDDNMSNYKSVKKWRQNNRELCNLRQREYRARRKIGSGAKPAFVMDHRGRRVAAQDFERFQLEQLKARDKGYEIDDYCQ